MTLLSAYDDKLAYWLAVVTSIGPSKKGFLLSNKRKLVEYNVRAREILQIDDVVESVDARQ